MAAKNTPVFDVVQENSGKYVAKLVKEDGEALDVEEITTATLTLWDSKSEAIINNRDEQNVLNLNNVSLDCAGNLVWQWTPLDMPKLSTKPDPEIHYALWIITWNGGDSQIKHDVAFRVHKVNELEE